MHPLRGRAPRRKRAPGIPGKGKGSPFPEPHRKAASLRTPLPICYRLPWIAGTARLRGHFPKVRLSSFLLPGDPSVRSLESEGRKDPLGSRCKSAMPTCPESWKSIDLCYRWQFRHPCWYSRDCSSLIMSDRADEPGGRMGTKMPSKNRELRAQSSAQAIRLESLVALIQRLAARGASLRSTGWPKPFCPFGPLSADQLQHLGSRSRSLPVHVSRGANP